jgi:hypothetical protein
MQLAPFFNVRPIKTPSLNGKNPAYIVLVATSTPTKFHNDYILGGRQPKPPIK